MWRLIKWAFFLSIIGAIVLWFTDYKVDGKTLKERVKPYLEQRYVKEAIRDIRTLVGGGLKAAGEAISEDVTDSERKQLDNVLKKELEMGKPIAGALGQKALPPIIQQPAKAPVQQTLKPVAPPTKK